MGSMQKRDKPLFLKHKWDLYYDQSCRKGGQSGTWESGLRKLGSFETVQEFWSYNNNIVHIRDMPDGANLRIFKSGINPTWEDKHNANGGTLSFLKVDRRIGNNMWQELLMSVIGDQLPFTDDICGLVLSVRPSGDRIQLWVRVSLSRAEVGEGVAALRSAISLCRYSAVEYTDHSARAAGPSPRSSHKDRSWRSFRDAAPPPIVLPTHDEWNLGKRPKSGRPPPSPDTHSQGLPPRPGDGSRSAPVTPISSLSSSVDLQNALAPVCEGGGHADDGAPKKKKRRKRTRPHRRTKSDLSAVNAMANAAADEPGTPTSSQAQLQRTCSVGNITDAKSTQGRSAKASESGTDASDYDGETTDADSVTPRKAYVNDSNRVASADTLRERLGRFPASGVRPDAASVISVQRPAAPRSVSAPTTPRMGDTALPLTSPASLLSFTAKDMAMLPAIHADPDCDAGSSLPSGACTPNFDSWIDTDSVSVASSDVHSGLEEPLEGVGGVGGDGILGSDGVGLSLRKRGHAEALSRSGRSEGSEMSRDSEYIGGGIIVEAETSLLNDDSSGPEGGAGDRTCTDDSEGDDGEDQFFASATMRPLRRMSKGRLRGRHRRNMSDPMVYQLAPLARSQREAQPVRIATKDGEIMCTPGDTPFKRPNQEETPSESQLKIAFCPVSSNDATSTTSHSAARPVQALATPGTNVSTPPPRAAPVPSPSKSPHALPQIAPVTDNIDIDFDGLGSPARSPKKKVSSMSNGCYSPQRTPLTRPDAEEARKSRDAAARGDNDYSGKETSKRTRGGEDSDASSEASLRIHPVYDSDSDPDGSDGDDVHSSSSVDVGSRVGASVCVDNQPKSGLADCDGCGDNSSSEDDGRGRVGMVAMSDDEHGGPRDNNTGGTLDNDVDCAYGAPAVIVDPASPRSPSPSVTPGLISMSPRPHGTPPRSRSSSAASAGGSRLFPEMAPSLRTTKTSPRYPGGEPTASTSMSYATAIPVPGDGPASAGQGKGQGPHNEDGFGERKKGRGRDRKKSRQRAQESEQEIERAKEAERVNEVQRQREIQKQRDLELQRQKREKQEREKVERENQERERQEREKLEREKREQEKLERERIARENRERERQEREKLEREKREQEKLERERVKREKQAERQKTERQERESRHKLTRESHSSDTSRGLASGQEPEGDLDHTPRPRRRRGERSRERDRERDRDRGRDKREGGSSGGAGKHSRREAATQMAWGKRSLVAAFAVGLICASGVVWLFAVDPDAHTHSPLHQAG